MRFDKTTPLFSGDTQPQLVDDFGGNEQIRRQDFAGRAQAKTEKDDAQAKAIELNLQRFQDFLTIEETDRAFIKGVFAPKVQAPVLSERFMTWLFTLAFACFWIGLWLPPWLLSPVLAVAAFIAVGKSILYRMAMSGSHGVALQASAIARAELKASTKAYHDHLLNEVRTALRQAPKKQNKDKRSPQGDDD